MNDMANDERLFALKIRNKLNTGATRLDRHITERLFEARQRALSHYTARSAELVLAGFGAQARVWWQEARRPVALALLLLVLAAGGDYLQSVQRASELEEVDSGLLTDDLPISAYLDHGFDAWLTRSEP